MKHFTLLIASLFIFISVSAQTVENEANPQPGVTEDNSEYAQLWGRMVAARKAGDQASYDAISREINQKYPEKFKTANTENSPFQLSAPDPTGHGEFLNGDLLVYGGVVAAPGTGNPNPVRRNLKLESDSLGNLFAGLINSNRDSLHLFRSTNAGYSWTRITSIFLSGTFRYQAFDMYITDSTNKHVIGFAATIYDNALGQYSSTLYWMQINTDATGFSSGVIQATSGASGYISPAIVSDGYEWSPGSTYWYITYQGVNTATGVGTLALLAMSTDWGTSWIIDTARSSFNDYDLDVEYSFGADSIYVLLTNNLTASNENLRLRYIQLAGIGTGIAWKQYNPANTADPEREGSMTANRTTNALMLTYTVSQGGNENIYYAYSPTGIINNFTTGPVSNGIAMENRSSVVSPEGSLEYLLSFASSAAGFDTVVYMETVTPPVFTTRQTVNQVNSSTGIAPDVSGYRSTPVTFEGGVLFAGASSGAYFDGTNIITGIKPVDNNTPSSFRLEQNYPNPFNPATNINFHITDKAFTSLKVYDMTGKEVAVVLNEELVPGSYKINFNAAALSTGVYFYKLVSGNFTDVKKMTLIK